MTTPYAEVIGDPIAHSKSPSIHQFWLAKLAIAGEYRATHVSERELARFFETRAGDGDWRGCNVTLPHKQAVIPFLDRLSPLAEQVGAVNTITRDGSALVGHNSDVIGIIDALAPLIPDPCPQACLIGSGGAALAALAAFKTIGISRVLLNVRDRAKGERMLAAAGMDGRVGAIDDADNLASTSLIVNATTLGMAGKDRMPQAVLDQVAAVERSDTIIFDMVYVPLETGLLGAARKRGLRTVDGLSMLIGQAAAAFGLFFGRPAPRQHDGALRAILTS